MAGVGELVLEIEYWKASIGELCLYRSRFSLKRTDILPDTVGGVLY